MNNSGKRCANCSHFEPMPPQGGMSMNLKAPRGGICRAHPPQVNLLMTGPGSISIQAHFPPVGEDQWCSEFQGGISIGPNRTSPSTPHRAPIVPIAG